MIYFEKGGPKEVLSDENIREGLHLAFHKIGQRNRVLAIPPDITRYHSKAGVITELAWEYFGERLTDILPALGTHAAMTEQEIGKMYGSTPSSLFRVHDWRRDVVTLGEVPSDFLAEVSEGRVTYSWPAQVNRLLTEGGHDLILSI